MLSDNHTEVSFVKAKSHILRSEFAKAEEIYRDVLRYESNKSTLCYYLTQVLSNSYYINQLRENPYLVHLEWTYNKTIFLGNHSFSIGCEKKLQNRS